MRENEQCAFKANNHNYYKRSSCQRYHFNYLPSNKSIFNPKYRIYVCPLYIPMDELNISKTNIYILIHIHIYKY